MIEIIFLLSIILTLFNFLIKRDWAYPPFIFSLTWCCVFLFYIIFLKTDFLPIYEISGFSLFVFFVGNLIFSLGGLIPFFYYDTARKPSLQIQSIYINYHFDRLLFLGIILLTPFFIYKAIQISFDTGIENFLLGLRYGLSVSSDNGYGLLKYLIPIAIFNTFYRYFIYQSDQKNIPFKIKFYISLILTILFLVLTTGRSNFLLLISLLASIKLLYNRLDLKYIFSFGFAFFILFAIFAVVLGKGGSIQSGFLENLNNVTKMFFWYMLGGLKAFDVFLQNQIDINNGTFVFRFIYAIGYKLGFSSTPPIDLVQPFLFIPLPTNVYTIYYTYIQDFGVFVSFIFIGMFSILHTVFYFRARAGWESDRFFYSLLMYPLIISFFQDQYFSLLSTWIQYTLFYLITFNVFIKINYKTTN